MQLFRRPTNESYINFWLLCDADWIYNIFQKVSLIQQSIQDSADTEWQYYFLLAICWVAIVENEEAKHNKVIH